LWKKHHPGLTLTHRRLAIERKVESPKIHVHQLGPWGFWWSATFYNTMK